MENNMVCGVLILMYGIGGLLCLIGGSAEPGNRGQPIKRLRSQKEKTWAWLLSHSKLISAQVRSAYRRRGSKIDREIFDSSVFLKNMAIAEKGRAFSADHIYEQLMYNSKKLQPIYGDMLSLYRSGRDSEAFECFAGKCGTRAARQFSMVLSKLDRIDPAELIQQMEVFQDVLAQKKMTEDLRKLDQSSAVTAFAATSVVFAQLINFTVVVVLLHTVTIIDYIF